jgi:hypothetical protein
MPPENGAAWTVAKTVAQSADGSSSRGGIIEALEKKRKEQWSAD